MTAPAPARERPLPGNTFATAPAQFAALAWAARAGGLTTSLAGTLLSFAMAVILYWMVFLILMVPRAERDGLIATARALFAGREAARR